MKYDIQFTDQFKKDLKLAKKQNKNLDKPFEVIDILANGGTPEAKIIKQGDSYQRYGSPCLTQTFIPAINTYQSSGYIYILFLINLCESSSINF